MNTLMNFPFNGNDVPLREMEHAELISIVTNEGAYVYRPLPFLTYTMQRCPGFPISIRTGRPVYRQAFQRLVDGQYLVICHYRDSNLLLSAFSNADPLFNSLQEIGFNKKQITTAEARVRACEEELLTLKSIGLDMRESYWSKSPVSLRAKYLMQKMRSCSQKIIDLEKRNAQLKKILAVTSS